MRSVILDGAGFWRRGFGSCDSENVSRKYLRVP